MAQTVNFSIAPKEMDRLTRKLTKYNQRATRRFQTIVEDTLLDIHRRAVNKVPVKRGDLKRSIRIEISDLKGKVIAGGTEKSSHVLHVEFGTGPHLILPREKTVLKFKIGGKTVFARAVSHPGTAAQPFMEPAAEGARPEYRKRVMREIIKART